MIKKSFTQAAIDILIGYLIAVLVQIIFFPVFNIETTFKENLTISAIFTVVSIIRSTCVRYYFNTRENYVRKIYKHKKKYNN